MTRATTIPELDRLAAVERKRTALEAEQLRLMARAQRRGASWEAIGAALGVSRQSAWETYHLRVRHLLELTALGAKASEDELLESAAASLRRVRAKRR